MKDFDIEGFKKELNTVKLDVKESLITDKIIFDLKLINTKSEKQIKYIIDIANDWTLSYGAFVGMGVNGFTSGAGLTYSKRLRKLKIK